MNTLLLHPTDILFFRDGRPMSGSLAGHGAAWPLPTVLNGALHAALWRADLEKVFGEKVHGHDQIKLYQGNRERVSTDTRKFGSLVTAGPFPVSPQDDWFFPRPADAQEAGTTAVTLRPVTPHGISSLPTPCCYAVGNLRPPSKDPIAPWWNASAWQAYLAGGTEKVVQVLPPANLPGEPQDTQNQNTAYPEGKAVPLSSVPLSANDADFSDTEHTIGIGIDPDTGTQDGERIYSAHYLRLRDGWRMGALAEAWDKVNGNASDKRDLIATLFPNSGTETPVIIGGQQRLCTVARHSNVESLPLPCGAEITGTRVKWILLTPAVWPEIKADAEHGIHAHCGGWLPNWIAPQDQEFEGEDVEKGSVLLLDGPGKEKARRRKLKPGKRIPAKLVAAIVPKALPVTGYAIGQPDAKSEIENLKSEVSHTGAKPTHLAVPAGAVYYFEAENEDAAKALATALNWHGTGDTTTIRNRRSTLFGEKGFGLGVCGMWDSHPSSAP